MHYLTSAEMASLRVTVRAEDFQPWALQQTASGVVSVSKSADERSVLELFCRRDGVARLRVSLAQDSAKEAAATKRALDEIKEPFEVFGTNVSRGDRTVTVAGTFVRTELRLPGFDIGKLGKNPKLSISDNQPRCCTTINFRPGSLNAQNFAGAGGIALRSQNCI
jgi:hypothetical protein